MKIAVRGKGGNGKSTVVALLAKEALNEGYHILIIEDTTRSAS